MADSNWIDAVAFNDDGLLPAIAQDAETGRVLMVAFMNETALRETVESGRAVYYSRSRKTLWRKGEESGHHQQVQDIQLDCDGDVILLTVSQAGGIACHTGRNSCFFRSLIGGQWVETEPVIKDPDTIYDRN
ncbi:MAG: phosphoribosyl-AMP cyclohydrolase [Gammaproteobacteria bacterium]|nr:phosphoribosyl-AMP cyclohydrolase [Gammaproteobacteria bacterium]